MEILLIFGVTMIALDLTFTLFGKPLFKPGPIAKSMCPKLTEKDGSV